MDENKSGWDRISEQDNKQENKKDLLEKMETGANIFSWVTRIILFVALVLVAIAFMKLTGINIFE